MLYAIPKYCLKKEFEIINKSVKSSDDFKIIKKSLKLSDDFWIIKKSLKS